MRVAAAQPVDMQIEFRRFRKRSPEVLGQLNRKVSNLLASRRYFIDQIETPRKIDHRTAQSFVHRHHRFAIPPDSRFVAQRLSQRLPQGDRDIFD